MEVIDSLQTTRFVIIRLDPGELLLENIRKTIADLGLTNGVVVSAIGTLKKCRMHVTTYAGFPPIDKFLEREGALELVHIQGIIADGEPHLHMTISDENCAYAGHLEDGCEVLYLAEIVIAKTDGMGLKREVNPSNGIKQLKPVKV
ncbi:MAG: DNA-binding protein [Firmicutes bacterium]|nr:DNA-binding protein [Bacillota bacterium]